MSRQMTAAMLAAMQADVCEPILLFKLATTGGDVRVWSGIGDITFNSEVYQGVGTLGRISEILETEGLEAAGVALELSGVPTSMISTALGQMRQDKVGTIWLGFLDSSKQLVADPIEIFSGLTDAAEIDPEGPDTSKILANLESRMIRLKRAKVSRFTDESQKVNFPNDRGFEYVNGLQDAQIVWGR